MFLLVNVASMDGCSIGSRVKGEMLMADVPQGGAVGGRLTADAPQGVGGKGRCSSWMFHAELGERADSHCRCFPASWEKGEFAHGGCFSRLYFLGERGDAHLGSQTLTDSLIDNLSLSAV